MIALIDADILVYRVGFTTQDVDPAIACYRMDTTIRDSILSPLNAEQYKCFLTSSDKSNFRFGLYAEYKANRKAPKPLHYEALRTHLLEAHDAEMVEGEEADDRLGIIATNTPDTVICSIDKDLLQIPGRHWHFVRKELIEISPLEGTRFFYKQLLMGDKPVDNIDGIYGIGTKIADKILKDCKTEEEMYQAVLRTYKEHYPTDYEDKMLLRGRLLKIRTREGELWQLPTTHENIPYVTTTALPPQNGKP
jgi:5'-3' exonuclease